MRKGPPFLDLLEKVDDNMNILSRWKINNARAEIGQETIAYNNRIL